MVSADGDPTPDGHECRPASAASRPRAWASTALRILRDNAYLIAVAIAAMVLFRVVDFSPPDKVRADPAESVDLVGEAPRQEFSDELGNEQAVQLRATLRLYDGVLAGDDDIGTPDPDVDERARLLSQPVVTTILGMNATLDQTVRLEGGKLEVDLSVQATPRELEGVRTKGKGDRISLEHRVRVFSRRASWRRKATTDDTEIHLDTSGVLLNVDKAGHRIVFTVDDHLFALDLELHRP